MQYLSWILFFTSGLCAIGYQLSWVKLFAAGLGHELPATFAVVTAFFGGLTLGARLLDRIGASARPARWYLGLEAIIFVWAFITLVLVDYTIELVHTLLGPDAPSTLYWFVAFISTLLALLPATVAMGGTLAAAENWYRQLTASTDEIGIVYLINTIGAAAGAMLVPFLLMPNFGFIGSMQVLLALNLFVAIGACYAGFSRRGTPFDASAQRPVAHAGRDNRLAIRLFIAGFLGIGFEVLGVRVMAQIFEGTIYSFSASLCIFLLGSALGGLLYHWLKQKWDRDRRLAYCVIGLSFAVILGVGVLSHAQGLYRTARGFFGDELLGVLGAELCLALPIYGLACTLMGALFCQLAAQARTTRGGIGWALSANTLGGMVSPAVIALLAIPSLGLKWTGVLLAFGYLALLPRPLPVARWVPLLPLVAAWLLPGEVQVVTLREGERVIAYTDGSVATVSVTERRSERNLRVDNRFQMGGTGATALRVQRIQAHLPLLLHDDPRRVLFLGLATGITSGAALHHPHVTLDAVELTPGVIDVLGAFKYYNQDLAQSNRVKLTNADARRFVRMSKASYDVIVGDLFQPARDGAGFLYTIEHFRAVRERLADGGIFCQWLPLYQMDEEIVRSIARTFVESFPHTEAWLGSFGVKYPVVALIGSHSPREIDLELLQQRMGKDGVQKDLARAAIRNPIQFLGHQLADDKRLRIFASDAAINRDDYPVVLFEAPQFTFHRGQAGYLTLAALINTFAPSPDNFKANPQTISKQIYAFSLARHDYLRAEIALAQGNLDGGIELLFSALDKSAEFTLAYAQLINVANQIRETEAKKAALIRTRLAQSRHATPP